MEKKVRTPMLEALCILSYLGNGAAFLIFLVAAIWNAAAREWIKAWSSLYEVSRFTSGYFLIFAALYLLSFFGVSGMWKLRKSGFYLYAAAQTTLLFFPSLWLAKFSFPSVVVIFTLLFMALYAREIFLKKPHSLDP